MITNPSKSLRKRPKPPSQKAKKRQIFRKPIFIRKLFRQKSTSYGSSGRSAKWKILVHWSSFFHSFCKNTISTIKQMTFTRCFALNPSFSFEGTFSFGAILDLFLEEYIAFCDGFDILLKYDPKNDLLNKKCPKKKPRVPLTNTGCFLVSFRTVLGW